jgi:poly-beta-1,6-N-acetyl-D-glucosamine synthase
MEYIFIFPLLLGAIHIAYIAVCLIFPGRNIKPRSLGESLPSIEHIVCFKNESKFVQRKIENSYGIDYSKIRHTFINDNSTDDTSELIAQFNKAGGRVINNKSSIGKNQSQIMATKTSQSNLLLFTDANVFLDSDAVKKIITAFDDSVGGVCGNVTIKTETMKKELSGQYWQLEKRIKKFQSRFGSVIGFDGGFYCVKRECYNLKRENELSDFETAFLIFEQDKKTKYVDNALAIEIEKRTLKSSFKARVRASNRVFWSYRRIFTYIGKLPRVVMAQFFFHKLLRYGSIISFVICLPMIVYTLYRVMPLVLLVFVIPFVYRLTLENIALFIGGVIAATGKEYTTWSDKKI